MEERKQQVKKAQPRSRSRQKNRLALQHQQEDFLAVLNHRLRTPVLASHRIIQLLLDGQFGDMTSKQKELISLLDQSMAEIDRLTMMIIDICRYRSRTKTLNLDYANVEDIISALLKNRDNKNLDVSVKINPPSIELWCDKDEISRMLNHILDNAFKHARTRISMNVLRNKADECVIRIEDDGKGIPFEDINDLFERFFVISSSGHYAPVTGAGLCLCNEIVKAHGGKISCNSIPDRGSCFEVRVPLHKALEEV